MKMAPGALPRPDKVPEQRLLSPELGFSISAALGRVLEISLWVLLVLGQEVTYRRRDDARGCQGQPGAHHVRVKARPRLVPLWWAPGLPLALLWTPPSFRVKTDVREFSAHSENISLRTFLKYKNSRKQKLARVILN